ncbi:MAG: MBL fold metallo-hydrolase [Clostridia bacterium]|nr:MBL fold metallo-hydrolase [Clostridia bacterium]
MKVTEPVCGIHILEVPFEEIYTAVFAVRVSGGYVLIDCATTARDVDDHILPALRRLGFEEAPIALLLTHRHGDHAGGAARLAEHFPHMEICSFEPLKDTPFRLLCENEIIGDRLQVIPLPGHTERSVGYLDLETHTLLTGDCLQQAGVGKYTNGIRFPSLYRQSIAHIRQLDLHGIIASHDYVPLGSTAFGEKAIDQYLNTCLAHCPKE